MPRELSHHASKFTFPMQLKGKSVIKSQAVRETLGRWENLITQGKTVDRVASPDSIAKRTRDNKEAKRTIQPQLNTENDKPQCRKIKSSAHDDIEPGSIMSLLKKSGTIKDVQPGSRKTFKEKGQVGETMYAQTAKTGIRVSKQRLEAYSSHISTLASPTYTESTATNYRDENGFRSSSPSLASPSFKRKQHHMRSAIGTLSNGEDTKRSYQDVDERKIWQSAYSPRSSKHLESTFQNQPTPMTQKIQSRKDPNRNSCTTYEDIGRLNPFTKGKKVSYPEHLERNTSAVWTSTAPDSFVNSTSPKYGGMEPLCALFSGRRAQSPKANFSNLITEPPTYKDNIRGSTVFSYRTYSSQIIF